MSCDVNKRIKAIWSHYIKKIKVPGRVMLFFMLCFNAWVGIANMLLAYVENDTSSSGYSNCHKMILRQHKAHHVFIFLCLKLTISKHGPVYYFFDSLISISRPFCYVTYKYRKAISSFNIHLSRFILAKHLWWLVITDDWIVLKQRVL